MIFVLCQYYKYQLHLIYKTIKEYSISIIIDIPNDDLLVCTSNDDRIFARGGNDNISASLGNNLIHGERGQ
ncbi:hypothetical protein [Nostoc sp. LPT]|uniref:hypothetical protein n=1 Tax=Nostoc sp. LPT TaxID=2815387 RepID=UPI001D8B7E52|nr:hypothetical protein [Nostoc sp. LPT]MBN4003598.1 hypothetical protein [Nostoc sp. LPT]